MFESSIGILKVETKPTNNDEESTCPTVHFEFEAYSTGKIYEIMIDELEKLQSIHKIFLFEPFLILDIVLEKPKIEWDDISESNVIITYNVIAVGKTFNIVFVLAPKSYPEGSNQEVIDLKRQIRLLNRQIDELIAPKLYYEIEIPYNKLVIQYQDAHNWLKKNDNEYVKLIESKENASVDNLVVEFINTNEKRLLFNLECLSRQGWEMVDVAEKFIIHIHQKFTLPSAWKNGYHSLWFVAIKTSPNRTSTYSYSIEKIDDVITKYRRKFLFKTTDMDGFLDTNLIVANGIHHLQIVQRYKNIQEIDEQKE